MRARHSAEYQDQTLRNLPCKRLQVDEIWCFVYAKQKNVARAKAAPAEAGDIWTWTAIDADTKLVPSWLVGSRDGDAAHHFIGDLAMRLANRVQLTSDGHRPYLEAVEAVLRRRYRLRHAGENLWRADRRARPLQSRRVHRCREAARRREARS